MHFGKIADMLWLSQLFENHKITDMLEVSKVLELNRNLCYTADIQTRNVKMSCN